MSCRFSSVVMLDVMVYGQSRNDSRDAEFLGSRLTVMSAGSPKHENEAPLFLTSAECRQTEGLNMGVDLVFCSRRGAGVVLLRGAGGPCWPLVAGQGDVVHVEGVAFETASTSSSKVSGWSQFGQMPP